MTTAAGTAQRLRATSHRAASFQPRDAETPTDRAAWLARYQRVRAFTEELCAPLHVEDYVIQSMPDASPAKWHLAHTSWFFQTFLLKEHAAGTARANPHYDFLFNSYYNAVGPMHCRAQRGMISRPTVDEVYAYRRQTDAAMQMRLEQATDVEWGTLAPTLELGLHHEQQHQELLLTDVKHLFAQNPLRPVYRAGPQRNPSSAACASRERSPLRWIDFAGGLHEIGHDGRGFAFDNEGPRHRVFLQSFQLADRLVTNAEYRAFIDDGGYQRPELWLSLGWMTVREHKWTAPLYWERADDGTWHEFTLGGLAPLDLSAPVVHVSYFEADAFARWAGARLPSEPEWEIAAAPVTVAGNLAESQRYHPAAASDDDVRAVARQPQQLYGDVWEWTRSAYAPYPGYTPPRGAVGEYNGKFMCNQYVLRGGSCATSRDHLRFTYRNFFPPEKRWQFTGIRLARDPA